MNKNKLWSLHLRPCSFFSIRSCDSFSSSEYIETMRCYKYIGVFGIFFFFSGAVVATFETTCSLIGCRRCCLHCCCCCCCMAKEQLAAHHLKCMQKQKTTKIPSNNLDGENKISQVMCRIAFESRTRRASHSSCQL